MNHATARYLALFVLASTLTHAQISSFKHIIVVFQENRTPDNLFQGLCAAPHGNSTSCSTKPSSTQYNIQTGNWLDKKSTGGTIKPASTPFVGVFDLGHRHSSFTNSCDKVNGVCKMDNFASSTCTGTCPSKPALKYVDYSSGILDPYLDLATQYGWANYMFQTNQGPSFPAHQFIFGGTSAPSASDDAIATFDAENIKPEVSETGAGCTAVTGATVGLITAQGERGTMFPCFEHETMSDLLDGIGVSWKYYTPGTNSIWTAPNAINHICQPNAPTGGKCIGPEWTSHVVIGATKILTDISNCKLAQVVWSIPRGQDSDHPVGHTGGGPSWVASIVNAIGNNKVCGNGENYWQNTAIIIAWDDWGGWYDHEPPTFLDGDQGDYQWGFRVPMIVVSAYTNAGYIDNTRQDFGAILRFIENNFGIEQGALGFSDARSTTNLSQFFHLNQAPRKFTTIAAPLDASHFINDLTPATDPDDD